MWICRHRLALARLQYEQEWPSLDEAKECRRQEEATAAHTILMLIRHHRLALARLQYEQEWPLLDKAKER
jgi:hypothetical protein